jgi:hypothetical protein
VLVTLDSEILVLSGFVRESHNSAFYTVLRLTHVPPDLRERFCIKLSALLPLGLLLRAAGEYSR